MSFQPVLVTELELSEPLMEIRSENFTQDILYGAALFVVRLHHAIMGTVKIPLIIQYSVHTTILIKFGLTWGLK